MFNRILGRPTASRNARRIKRTPTVETLEGRQLLSLGAPFVVDNGNFAQKSQVATATSSNGSSVVVWVEGTYDTLQNLGTEMIKGQYYNAAGGKQGPQFIVAFNTPGVNNEEPAVAMDAHGDFVVSWTLESASHNVPYVLAQKYNPQCNPIDGLVGVGTGTFRQHQSSVAMDAYGDFVVAYTRDTNNNNPDVFAKVYFANSQLRYVENVATTPLPETNPKVAMDPYGNFDVAYQVYNPSYNTTAINVARYAAGLNELGILQVSRGATCVTPSIAMDNTDDAVVAYQTIVGNTESVYAARISSTGNYTGPIYVSGPGGNFQIGTIVPKTSIAVDPNGGKYGAFEVAYNYEYSIYPNTYIVAQVARVDSSDSVGVPDTLGSSLNTLVLAPSISALGSSGYLAAFTSSGTSSSNNVYGQRRTYN